MTAGRIALVAILAAAAGASQPAAAKPRCHEGIQDIGGRQISTPYCEDLYLAQVAREYGSRISFETIRDNPNAKKDICRLVGRDIRVNQTCNQYESGRGRF